VKSWIGDIPNTHVRDFQRKKVYDAEDKCIFWEKPDKLPIYSFRGKISQIADWAKVPVPTILEDGHEYAYATPTQIVLPYPITKTMPFICHEMAHVINYNTKNADHHGKHFATVYLAIVKKFIGKDAYEELVSNFRAKNVQYLTHDNIDDIMRLSNKTVTK
tara:strand:+ start:1148 stop:1630 length:483 start_codon:yes stop_codon:yes gene_type:complete